MSLIDPWADPDRWTWKSAHVEWIRAANSLPFYERMNAYRDIAQMAGVDISKVKYKAARVRITERQQAGRQSKTPPVRG